MCIPRKYKWQVRYFIIYHERALHDYFIPCHRNTVDSTIKATCARRMMGRLNVIQRLYCNLIGCIFYGMAYKRKQISVNTRAVIRQFSRPHSTVEPGKIENCFCGKNFFFAIYRQVLLTLTTISYWVVLLSTCLRNFKPFHANRNRSRTRQTYYKFLNLFLTYPILLT